MAQISSTEAEKEAIIEVAELMAVSVRTAPKTRGLDSVKTVILHGDEELEKLARAMEQIYHEDAERLPFFQRNAEDVRKSAAVLVIGVTGEPKRVELPLDCGACGMNCSAMQKAKKKDTGNARGPICLMQGIDLGIAIGSAVKAAADYNVDNRVMYSIGVGARRLKLIEADLVAGIPLSATGRNLYFADN